MSHKRDEILPLAATQINPLCKMVGQAKKHHTESQKKKPKKLMAEWQLAGRRNRKKLPSRYQDTGKRVRYSAQ